MGGVNKREHLIVTGQELIWARGYDLCSIKDITDAAGLPKGSFYHYFDSKEKFALEAMHEFVANNGEDTSSEGLGLGKLDDILDARIESIVKIQFQRECYMSVMCHAYTDQDESFRNEVVCSIEESNESMKGLLHELKDEGFIDSKLDLDELLEFIDFAWRGARLKARILRSERPLKIFKKYIMALVAGK